MLATCKLYIRHRAICKGLATRSDENEQDRSNANTKLFRSSLDLSHEPEDTPVVRSDGQNTMLLFYY